MDESNTEYKDPSIQREAEEFDDGKPKEKSDFLPEIKITVPSQADPLLSERIRAFLSRSYRENKHQEGLEEVKLPKEETMINLSLEILREYLEENGLASKVIDMKNIHIINEEVWERWMKNNEKIANNAGFYQAIDSAILMPRTSEMLDAEFLQTLIHELTHHNSFTSFRSDDGSRSVYKDQSGFMLIRRDSETSSDEEIGRTFNEAVTMLMTSRLMEKIKSRGVLAHEEVPLEIRDKVESTTGLSESKILGLKMISKDNDEAEATICLDDSTRQECYAIINLVHKIYTRGIHEHQNQDQIMDEFIEAYFSGNLHTVVRLTDRTFGDGTFRKILSMNSPEELYDFITAI